MNTAYRVYKGMCDEDLINAIIGGDHNAMEFLLLICCGRQFKHICNTYKYSGFETADLIQEMYSKLIDNNYNVLHSFIGKNHSGEKCRLVTYIITIAARWMKKKNSKLMTEIAWDNALINIESDNADEYYFKQQVRQDIIKMIMQLDDHKEKLVLLQYKIKGESVEHVASLLKTNVNNIYTICSRAMKNLRLIIEKEGFYA